MECRNKDANLRFSRDVTDEKSVLHVDRAIHQQLPPVGGVVNGAMLLTDYLFADVSLETLHNQFKPKVQGSLILDELYSGHDLDFFILFGSLVGIVGNWSQSAYSAATSFMSGLIRSRHDRGLVGSIIHPGVVRGVGYVSHAGASVAQHMRNTMGTHSVPERALHELFAEAILAGSPGAGRNSEICAGMSSVDPIKQPNIIWYQNPKAWHFVEYHTQFNSNQATSGEMVPLRTQLTSAESVVEAGEIIREGFISTLCSKLQLPSDGSITPDTRLAELGVDSLVAVDIRMWFTKELSVDISVLQIMSGSSIGQIANDAAAKLPGSYLPSVLQANDPEASSKPEQDQVALQGKAGIEEHSDSSNDVSSYEMVSSRATSDTNQEPVAESSKGGADV